MAFSRPLQLDSRGERVRLRHPLVNRRLSSEIRHWPKTADDLRYFLDLSAARGLERISSTFALSVGSFPCRYALRSGSLSFPQKISSSTANVGTPNTPA